METAELLEALQEIERRAERVDDEHVINTYVQDSTLINALFAHDNGVVYGRRGTGKTHALKYLAETERAKGNFVIYIDMEKDLGSTGSVYSDSRFSLAQRATRLLVDVIGMIHDALLEEAFGENSDTRIEDLEKLLDHFGEVLVAENAEVEKATQQQTGSSAKVGVAFGRQPGLSAEAAGSSSASASERVRTSGVIDYRVHFGAVGDLLRRVVSRHPAGRFWLLFDEWSGLPQELQPYLGEMLRKIFFSLAKVTVRIAAIPHRTDWRVLRDSGSGYIGLEMGAEIFPVLDLDEFVVFPARSKEERTNRSTEFFKQLLFRHTNQALSVQSKPEIENEQRLVSLLFTQMTALQELVRAAEGVPRDALTIVARAALRAGKRPISTENIRYAASQVFQTTKQALLNGALDEQRLLDFIIREVISAKRARAFLLAQGDSNNPLIQRLIDDRILHTIKKGYSSHSDPGVRFDVLQIDYGCYVQLLQTQSAPQNLLGSDGPNDDQVLGALYADAEVPEDDYRAIRRAVLSLDKFLKLEDAPTSSPLPTGL